MSETTARDALLAEILGELYTLRDDVTHLMAIIPDARAEIEKGGEYATLKFSTQTDQMAAVLDTRIRQMVSAVKDIGAMREMLVGLITAQATEQAKVQLFEAVREVSAAHQIDNVRQHIRRILSGIGGAVIGGALVATTDVALRIYLH